MAVMTIVMIVTPIGGVDSFNLRLAHAPRKVTNANAATAATSTIQLRATLMLELASL
jgi:hypothetical protein